MEPALTPITFPGPAGPLEGLWKEAAAPRSGGAVFAHPHPLHGGTLHNKVVYRAAKTLSAAGYATLRFNFRGVGLSAGRFDSGVGERDDYRSAIAEAERRAGVPLLAGGFSFGAGVALQAIAGDARVAAFVGVGVPVASELFRNLPRPEVPALFVVGEHDIYGPPAQLRHLMEGAGTIVEIPGADHFLAGNLPLLEEAMLRFLAELRAPVSAP